jgi:hypothetical protein
MEISIIPGFGPCGVCNLPVYFGSDHTGNYCIQCHELLHHGEDDCYQLHNQIMHPFPKNLRLIGGIDPSDYTTTTT